MKEILELRVKEEHAPLVFSESEGERLGTTVRRVELSPNDPRMADIAEWERKLNAEGSFLFAGWKFRRTYSKEEISAAELFHLQITTRFEPEGESCGTIYDSSGHCPLCGAGRRQVSPLVLDLHRVPRSKDIVSTIADEWVVSQRLADLIVSEGVTGIELARVRHRTSKEYASVDLRKTPSGLDLLRKAGVVGLAQGSWEFDVWLNQPEQEGLWRRAVEEQEGVGGKEIGGRKGRLPVWYQLIPKAQLVEMAADTRVGINPVDLDTAGRYRCPLGHVLGLSLLSEVFVNRGSWDGSDIARTRGLVGVRRGVLVPAPILLVSPRFRRLLKDSGMTGAGFEVAHLVD
jgi:hypothetical protein